MAEVTLPSLTAALWTAWDQALGARRSPRAAAPALSLGTNVLRQPPAYPRRCHGLGANVPRRWSQKRRRKKKVCKYCRSMVIISLAELKEVPKSFI